MSYEVGSKGNIGSFLTYEAAVYYQDWKSVQQNITVLFNNLPSNAKTNAGDAGGWGSELTLTLRPTRGLSIYSSVGWNDLKFTTNTTTLVGGAPALLFAKGERLSFSPAWTGSVGASYRRPLNTADTSFVFDTSYIFNSPTVDRFLGGPTGTTRLVSKSDSVQSLRLSFGLDAPHWSLMLVGENVTNYYGIISPPNLATLNSLRPRPKTIGLQASFKY